MPNAHKLVVVTPWYPTEQQPYKAAFVREWTATLGLDPAEVLTIHLDNVAPGESDDVEARTDAVGQVLRIPVVAAASTPRDEMARLFRERLLAHASAFLTSAEAVHAHVALPSGWGVLSALPDAVPLTYVEHASYLPALLKSAVTREQIGAVVSRANAVLTPGAREAQQLRRWFPQQRTKIQSVGNPLDFAQIPVRTTAVSRFDRWLTLSNLVPLKRVDEAVRTFALWHSSHPQARLTVAGAGTELAALQSLAESLGVSGAVEFRGAVPREDIGELLQNHDLLLHLSTRETFAIAPLEAVAAGLALVITQCGGPEETLFLARQTDQVRFVAPGAQAPVVLRAVADLAQGLPVTSAPANRAELAFRYDVTNFGLRLAATLRGELPLSSPSGAGGKYAVLSTHAPDQPQLVDLFQALLSRDAQCALVVPSAEQHQSLDGRIDLVEVPPTSLTRIRIATQLWVQRAPVLAALRLLRLGAKVVTLLPGKLAKLGRGVRRKTDQLRAGVWARSESQARRLHAAALARLLSSSGGAGDRARTLVETRLPADTQVVLLSDDATRQFNAFTRAGLSLSGTPLASLAGPADAGTAPER